MIPRAMLACTKPTRVDKQRRSRSVETLAGFHTPIFILVTRRQRRAITHASNYIKTDEQLLKSGNEHKVRVVKVGLGFTARR